MFESLTPKGIILNQLESRFKSIDIVKLMLIYNLTENQATCKGLNSKGQTIPIEVEQKENDMIQTMLIKKISSKLTPDSKELIVKIDMVNKSIDMYINGSNGLAPFNL